MSLSRMCFLRNVNGSDGKKVNYPARYSFKNTTSIRLSSVVPPQRSGTRRSLTRLENAEQWQEMGLVRLHVIRCKLKRIVGDRRDLEQTVLLFSSSRS